MIFLLSTALAASGFNHPEIQWKTVATEHFLIHYYDRTESAVFAVAQIAEEVYGPLSQLYKYSPAKGKVNISLADYDDYTNGFAQWTADNIQIWLPDDRFDLRSNTTWLRNVITHELAHIASLSKKGVQLLDWVIGAGYQGPSTAIDILSPVALTRFYPAWFIEGTAQRESERAGNDCWDSRRDMALRCAVLDNRLLSLEEMGWFNHDGLGSEMVYNQGFSFVKYLEDTFGVTVIAELWKQGRGAQFSGGSFDQLFFDLTGQSLQNVYRAWRDSLRAVYASHLPTNPSAAAAVWTQGRLNDQPRVSPCGGLWGWLTSDKDDYGRTDLLIMREGAAVPAARIPWAKTSWCFSHDGAAVFYIKSRDNNEAGSFFNDVFARDLRNGTERRITVNGRIYDVTAFPDGKRLLTVRYHRGAFSLAICHIETGVFTEVIPAILGEPFQGLSINPADPSRAVTCRVIDGQANIYIVNIDSARLAPLCQTPAQEETPHWAADGRIYFSADYDGIYNIYSILPDGGDLRRHSWVQGGAFSPELDAKGRILFSSFTSGGFQIAIMDRRNGEPFELPNAVACAFQPLPKPKGNVRLISKEYKAKPLRAVLEMHSAVWLGDPSGLIDSMLLSGNRDSALGNLQFAASAGLTMYRSDALQKKQRFLGVSLIYDNSILAKNSESDTSSIIRTVRIMDGSRRGMAIHPFAFSLYNGMRSRQTHAAVSQAEEENSAGSGAGFPPLFLMPQFVMQNRTLQPTLTLQIDALAYLLPIPLVVQAYFDAEWRAARDWHLGITPMGYAVALLRYGGFFLPLWLNWQTYGYVNEDIAYTFGGVSRFGAYIQPGIEPMTRISFRGDTTGEFAASFRAGFTVDHGFPLAQHLSVVESFAFGFDVFSGFYLDPDNRLEAPSRRILEAKNKMTFNFPLIRNINAGRWRYLEDLYGRIFYAVTAIANDVPLDNPSRQYVLWRRYDRQNFALSHTAGFSAVLGMSHAYAFSRTLEMTLAYDWWNYRALGSVRLGF